MYDFNDRLLGNSFLNSNQQVAAVECLRLACNLDPSNEELKVQLKRSLKAEDQPSVSSNASTAKAGLAI